MENLNPNTNLGINSNLTLNATNSIIVQYQEGTMENLISSTNDNFNYNLNDLGSISDNFSNLATIIKNNQESTNPNNNHQELQYLKTLNNLSQSNQQNNPQNNPNKITLNKIVIKI